MSQIFKSETGDGNRVFTYSREELSGIVDHINSKLKNDADVRHIVPINPENEDIFLAVSDGILLCKFINAIVPESIPPKMIAIKVPMRPMDQAHNILSALKASLKLGVKLDMGATGATDFFSSNGEVTSNQKAKILGLLWQLVKVDLWRRVQDVEKPTDDEDADQPEEILLRWVNAQLQAAEYDRQISDFSNDIKDSLVYTVLLHQLAPETCTLEAMTIGDVGRRAQLVLDNAARIDCRKFINARNIVQGDARLNSAFVANLFTTFNKPKQPEPEPEPQPEPDLVPSGQAAIEAEIRRVNAELQAIELEAEKEELEKETVHLLQVREQQLQKQLDDERARTDALMLTRDDEIRRLRQQLVSMQDDQQAFAHVSIDDIKRKLDREVEERAQLVARMRAREDEIDQLRTDLQEQQQDRVKAERRFDAADKSLSKAQEKHKTELDRLRKMLLESKRNEDRAEQELVVETAKRDEQVETVHQLSRVVVKLGYELNEHQSDKSRLESVRRKMESERRRLEQSIEQEKSKKKDETRIALKAATRLTRLQERNADILMQKNDLTISTTVVIQQAEQLKDQLITEQEVRTAVLVEHVQRSRRVDALEAELEQVEQQRRDEVQGAERRHKAQLERQRAELERDKRLKRRPAQALQDESERLAEQLSDTRLEQESLALQAEAADERARELTKQLADKVAAKTETLEDIAAKERELRELRVRQQELSLNQRRDTEQEKKARLQLKKLKADEQLTQLDRDQQQKELEELELSVELLRQRREQEAADLKAEQRQVDELAERCKAAELELSSCSDEAQRTRLQATLDRQREQADRQRSAVQRRLERDSAERADIERQLAARTEELETLRRERVRATEQRARKETEARELERENARALEKLSDAERAKQKLDSMLERAARDYSGSSGGSGTRPNRSASASTSSAHRHRSSADEADSGTRTPDTPRSRDRHAHDAALNTPLANGALLSVSARAETTSVGLMVESSSVTVSTPRRTPTGMSMAEWDSKLEDILAAAGTTEKRLKKDKKDKKDKKEKGEKKEKKSRKERIEVGPSVG
eukprot:TRINITY_DN1428_c0_g1_i1.p1 TRINITY_DN1428_c0_g1~~TRINITY_DN1428_c0_g1_i1.p1  ORF type:complete len:1059 (-),score=472.95 TRINITY_DN1428_c0_g1_i1:345-3521(-)